MTANLTPQPPPAAGQPPAAYDADPRSLLRPGLAARGEQGRALGKLDAVERDATGRITALIIRHGLLRRGLTSVPATRIKQVNQDSVRLACSAAEFKRLPPLPRA